MDSNWDGVGFVKMKQKLANYNFVVEGGVGFETTNALAKKDK
jgi:hypothetical protein